MVGRAGDAEVGELDDVGVRDEQVAGLDVAVDDAVAMGVIEPAAGLGDDSDRLVDAEMAVIAQQFGAGVARHVLHHDEVLVVTGVEAEVEHLDDVRVHEPGGRERLAPEPGDERRIVGEVLGQELQRDVALEAAVEREVDGRHPADAESAFDPVPARDRGGAGHPPEVLVAPPTGAPPPVVVLLEVPVPPPLVAVVGGGVEVVVGGVVVVDEVVDVWVWVTVVEAWVEVVGTVTVGVDVDCVVQSLAASAWTVLAPWPRFATSFWLTPDGSATIRLVKRCEATVALPQ